jgi:murein DD-endopeptidase MepM/ murein hydrolase activator NlpD
VASGVEARAALGSLPKGTFDDPLTSPKCSGYRQTRGYTSAHNGADLAKNGGCPIRAVAAGTVTYAGWKGYGAGYTVIIDHGGGVETQYLHGDGNIWVKAGQHVSKGQDIMYMGTTGNSTGVHLHLTLKYKGVAIDPSPYIPYRR